MWAMRASFGMVVVGALLGACSLLTSYDDLRGDAGDASSEGLPPPIGCTLAVTPSLVTINPITGTNVTLTLTRTGAVGDGTVSYSPGVAYVTPPTLTFAASDTVSGPFTLQPGASALAQDITITASFANNAHCSAVATIAISGVLATFSSGNTTTFTVPKTTFLTQLSFDVWGGGGGGGGAVSNSATPGSGGGGGLSFATIDVVPNESLTITGGTGGGGNTSSGGGGGGGCSEVLRGTTLLIVGAGGGGGGACENENGANGGGGGQPGGGTSAGTGGGAGTMTTGGKGGSGGSDGGSLQGGSAKQASTSGGSPGGGKGGSAAGGGGGGCGVFGGGGGGPDSAVNQFAGSGGGGGSGMITGDAGAILTTKTATPPFDPRFALDSGVNTAGALAVGGVTAPGGTGCVVVSIP